MTLPSGSVRALGYQRGPPGMSSMRVQVSVQGSKISEVGRPSQSRWPFCSKGVSWPPSTRMRPSSIIAMPEQNLLLAAGIGPWKVSATGSKRCGVSPLCHMMILPVGSAAACHPRTGTSGTATQRPESVGVAPATSLAGPSKATPSMASIR